VAASNRHRRRWALVPVAVAGAVAAQWLPAVPAGHAAGGVGFTQPMFLDSVRAGGEPVILSSTKFGTLVYSSHEGTTHLDRVGATNPSTLDFVCPDPSNADCYRNRVWIWTSADDGATWTLRDQGLTNQGFSDPDLTQDQGGNIYDTGIDLANDSVYSSADGGKTWSGTTNCNEGDRPWLTGGKAGEVFVATDEQTLNGGHALFHSGNGATSCDGNGLDSNGVPDFGTLPDGRSWTGVGKGVYDPVDGSFVEPARFSVPTPGPVPGDPGFMGGSSFDGVGISYLPNAADAFKGGGETFHPTQLVFKTTQFSPFGGPELLVMDSQENLYFAWDTDDRQPNTSGGCSAVPNQSGGPSGNNTPLPNRIMFVAGKHVGPGQWQWLKPISLSHQGNARVLWPWSVVGSPGNVSVVWYQMDKLVDPDCDGIDGNAGPDVKTYIYEAHITDALDPGRRGITVTNASGRAIHEGGICDSGTTCVATGQDRRLGDYFSNALDPRGCVIIASGDTTVPDQATGQARITSLPIFIRQNSGPSLTTGLDCATTASSGGVATATASASSSPGAPAPVTLPNTAASAGGAAGGAAAAALLAGGGAWWLRRRRRRRREGAGRL
jgi:LPXTG-motif cell wall-anchored protein